MKVATLLGVVVVVALLSSCYSIEALFDWGPYEIERVTEDYELHTEENYRVGVGDYLDIQILAEDAQGMPIAPEDFRRTVQVLPDGSISYLYNDVTGELHVVGKTVAEIVRMFERQLVARSKLYMGARVSVIVASSLSSTFYVAGEVRNPGAYRLSQPTTITQAIIRAGWFSEFADRENIQIVRRDGDRETRYTFNYTDWERRPRATRYHDKMIRPNDIIVVPD